MKAKHTSKFVSLPSLGAFVPLLAFMGPAAEATELPDWPSPKTQLAGDTNGEGEALDLSDVIYLLGYLFQGGPAPVPLGCPSGELAPRSNGDANGDWRVDLSDAIYLIHALFLAGPPPASACDFPDLVLPPDSRPYGLTYGEWSALWWRWAMCIPATVSPLVTGTHCEQGQKGPVFFLPGAYASNAVTRTCTAPFGKSILLAIINAECSTLEPVPYHCTDPTSCQECAAPYFCQNDPVRCPGSGDAVTCSIDGKEIPNLAAFRVQSPFFHFTIPEKDNILGVDGKTEGDSVSDGYWVFIPPFKKRGVHTIHFTGSEVQGPTKGFSQDVSYELTVE